MGWILVLRVLEGCSWNNITYSRWIFASPHKKFIGGFADNALKGIDNHTLIINFLSYCILPSNNYKFPGIESGDWSGKDFVDPGKGCPAIPFCPWLSAMVFYFLLPVSSMAWPGCRPGWTSSIPVRGGPAIPFCPLLSAMVFYFLLPVSSMAWPGCRK